MIIIYHLTANNRINHKIKMNHLIVILISWQTLSLLFFMTLTGIIRQKKERSLVLVGGYKRTGNTT